MRTTTYYILFLLLVNSCIQPTNETRKIQIDPETYAEGSISDDTIFNGLIKFTSKASGNMLYEAFYSAGILHGAKTDFYRDGTIRSSGTYENGKLNGVVSFFDSLKNLAGTQYYYYDLPVGPRIAFLNGSPSEYKFYSFDNLLLFKIDYDSVNGRRISDLQSNFFFISKRPLFNIDKSNNILTEYFIYTPSPPKYDFQYDLVEIDSSFNIISTIQSLDESRPISSFTIDQPSKRGMYALRLKIEDSINNEKSTMFKKLLLELGNK